MARRRFPAERFISTMEQRLIMQFDSALNTAFKLPVPDPERREPYPLPTYSGSNAGLHSFYERMALADPEGYVVGARVIMEGLAERHATRELYSIVFTKLSRMVYESSYGITRAPRESEVAFMGRMVTTLLPNHTTVMVEWFEDMHDGNDACSLLAQPTEIIRGILISPHFDHDIAEGFWTMASKSPRFPDRVFSDPCSPDEGGMFSSFQVRRLGHMFNAMPLSALERFTAHMQQHAWHIRTWHIEDGKRTSELVRLGTAQRDGLFRDLVSHVHSEERQTRMNDILFSASPPVGQA